MKDREIHAKKPADIKLAKSHLKKTIALEKRKASEHEAALGKPGRDDRYNRSHAKNHRVDVQAEQAQLRIYNAMKGR